MGPGDDRELIPLTTDDEPEAPEESASTAAGTVGLCLSGGGFRAMLFHAGVLWRLHETGWLARVDRVASVSGGSITAGVLATRWASLAASEGTYEDLVVAPLRDLASRTLDVRAVLGGLLPGRTAGQAVERVLDDLLGGARLGDLPEHPAFVVHATNVSTGKLVRFDRERVSDWRIGSAGSADVALASAVTASAAFPPVLSPYRLDTRGLAWRSDGGGTRPDAADFRDELWLTDGGVYDNLALESLWQRSSTVLVSDGGGALDVAPGAATDWPRHVVRVTQVIDHQVRSLRTRQVQTAFARGEKAGTHIGIRRQESAPDRPPGHLPVADADIDRIAAMPTRLKRLTARDQERLLNWGYAIADIKLRTHVDDQVAPPDRFPLPGGIA